MIASSFIFLVLADAAAPSAIERCRAAHAGDAPEHIACLEAALRGAAPTPPVEDEMGLDQIKQRERAGGEGNDPIHVQIESVSYDAKGRGIFRTANGQVWRETETIERRPRVPDSKQRSARIERGSFGGYRMYVDGIRWMYKVERLE